MFDVCLSVTQHADELLERLGYEFGSLSEEGLEVVLSEDHKGNLTFIDCVIEKEAAVGGADVLRHSVASAVTDIITSRFQDDLLKKILVKNYGYLNEEEKRQILDDADKVLQCDSASGEEDCLKQVLRRDNVMKRVFDALQADASLAIDGFIRFRLKDYVEELSDAVDKAVDGYLMDKEYREFVRLLKYFVDIQEPRIPEVHVTYRSDGLYRLVDESGENVSSDYLESPSLLDSDVDYDDLLISALIAISPVEVKIHLNPSLTVVKTILSVFEGRASLCADKGCEMCSRFLRKGPKVPGRD